MNLLEDVEMEKISLDNILKEILKKLPEYIGKTIYQFILVYAEKTMRGNEVNLFPCEKCGECKELNWKTKHGKETKFITLFGILKIPQMQIQCKVCGHKYYITRKLLGIEPRKRISKGTEKQLGLTGSLTSFRVSAKILSFTGGILNKMTVWRCVQKIGEEIKFDLDENELPEGEADGTGIPTYGKGKRGSELKVFTQKKKVVGSGLLD